MAFGLKYIRDVEKDKVNSLYKNEYKSMEEHHENLSEDTLSVVEKATVGDSPIKQSTHQVENVSLETEKPKRTNRKTDASEIKFKKSLYNDGDVTPEMYGDMSDSVDSQDSIDEDDKKNINVLKPLITQKEFLLNLKRRHLIQEVGAFKKWSPDVIAQWEKTSLSDPEKLNEIKKIYQEEIEPLHQNGLKNLQEALHKYKNNIVFLLIKNEKMKLKILEKDTPNDILHGCVLESLQYNATPFEQASHLFPSDNEMSSSQKMVLTETKKVKP